MKGRRQRAEVKVGHPSILAYFFLSGLLATKGVQGVARAEHTYLG